MKAEYSTESLRTPIFCMFMLAAVFSTPGCSHYWPAGTVDSNLLDPQGKLTLCVANDSYAVSPVDIRVEIDGQTVVHGYFRRGRSNPTMSLRVFKLALDPGMHKLHVVSTKGKAELSREFEVTGEHWMSVCYDYRPDTQDHPVPKHFTFDFQDEQIRFR